MRKLLLLGPVLLGLAGSAQARDFPAGGAVLRAPAQLTVGRFLQDADRVAAQAIHRVDRRHGFYPGSVDMECVRFRAEVYCRITELEVRSRSWHPATATVIYQAIVSVGPRGRLCVLVRPVITVI